MKTILFALLLVSVNSFSQYIGVKARYTETRLVDDSPNPPRRENHLILSFFEVSPLGVYTPTILSDYDLYVYKEGLQYGSLMGGVVDSAGNNYEGYGWTAPKAVAYFNTMGLNYIDCNPNIATHYVVNGHELDCGFVTVSYWVEDPFDFGLDEYFTAPNICLPYYQWPDIYALSPGNVNFAEPIPATAPYNSYNFSCGASLQLVRRGVLAADTGGTVVTLPVRFANVRAGIDAAGNITISWSNMTESDILNYMIENSVDGISFQPVGMVLPTKNNGDRADYNFLGTQTATRTYYRIKATENNGANLYSSIISLSRSVGSIDNSEAFSIYPNPIMGGEFTFRLSNAPAGRYIACIITPGGQQIKHKMIEHTSRDLIRKVDMSDLPSGVYRLILRSAEKKFTQTILYVN